jgi:hypothetical protein
MPAEHEELRISVVLDDPTSAQLQRIQREVAAIGGGPSHIPRAPHEVCPCCGRSGTSCIDDNAA